MNENPEEREPGPGGPAEPPRPARSGDEDPAPALAPRAGGGFELFGEIARGGMGIVLRGRDPELGREVAVKVLDARLVDDPAVAQRFVEEAQIGGQLQHPGVVPIYELGRLEDGRPFFVMKLIEGSTLAELLAARGGPERDRRRFLAIFEAVCQTVAYAHSKGVVHRDLKPANVMVGAFGEVQVVDWGLAKVLSSARRGVAPSAAPGERAGIETVRSGPDSQGLQSLVGSVLGTPAYMAPEQARGAVGEVDERTDVFALGGILCEILTGCPPYVAGEGEHTLLLAADARLEAAHARLAGCEADADLKDLARQCLSAAREERPADAAEVASRVQAHLTSLEERAHRAELAATEARELRRRQRLVLVLVTTVFVAAGAIGLVLRSAERQRRDLREQEIAAAGRRLDDAAGEIGTLQDEESFDRAVEVARGARDDLLASGPGDAALSERARRLVEQAESRAADARRRLEQRRRNEELLARGTELRARQLDPLLGWTPDAAGALERSYQRVFRNYGIDLSGEDTVGALDDLVAIGIGPEVGLVLDDWAVLRRRTFGPGSLEVEAVTTLALDLDPEPARCRLRKVLLADDEQALLAFAREEDLSALAPSTLWALNQGLDRFGRDDEGFRVVRDGAVQHPDDFLLDLRVGQLYAARGAHSVAITFLSSAIGARPDSATAYGLLGDSLREMGDLPRALESYEEALRLDPRLAVVRNSLGWLQVRLGDYAGAERTYEGLAASFPEDASYDFKLLIARFLQGNEPREEVVARLETDERLAGRLQGPGVWALTFHPDPAQRDPARVIAIQDSWGHEEPATEITEAAALLQLGRPADALRTLAHGQELGAMTPVQSAECAVYGARAHLELGDPERCRRLLDLAEKLMGQVMVDGPEPWASTSLARAYRETRERLGD